MKKTNSRRNFFAFLTCWFSAASGLLSAKAKELPTLKLRWQLLEDEPLQRQDIYVFVDGDPNFPERMSEKHCLHLHSQPVHPQHYGKAAKVICKETGRCWRPVIEQIK